MKEKRGMRLESVAVVFFCILLCIVACLPCTACCGIFPMVLDCSSGPMLRLDFVSANERRYQQPRQHLHRWPPPMGSTEKCKENAHFVHHWLENCCCGCFEFVCVCDRLNVAKNVWKINLKLKILISIKSNAVSYQCTCDISIRSVSTIAISIQLSLYNLFGYISSGTSLQNRLDIFSLFSSSPELKFTEIHFFVPSPNQMQRNFRSFTYSWMLFESLKRE